MFQIQFYLPDIGGSRHLYNRIDFEAGQWFHAGWSFYNDASTVYKNGCLHNQKYLGNGISIMPSILQGVRFGMCDNAFNMDLQIDEVYFWEERKPAHLFSVLYINDI